MDDFAFIRRSKELTERAKQSETPAKTLGASIAGIRQPRTIKTTLTPEQLAQAKLERDAAELAWVRSFNDPMHRFRNVVGKAYAECRFSNFRTTDKHGQAIQSALRVVNRLKGVAEHIGEAVKAMRQIVLYGKPGVGKDHLIAALLWEAQQAGCSIKWANGERFAALVRDQLDYQSKIPDRVWLRQWIEPAVLALSDPDGEASKIPDPVKQRLYDVVDARIREGRPTWITINGDNESHIESRIGARIHDRLRQNAWVLHCDWESGRRPRGGE
jgi:DNA replication protein DnaC